MKPTMLIPLLSPLSTSGRAGEHGWLSDYSDTMVNRKADWRLVSRSETSGGVVRLLALLFMAVAVPFLAHAGDPGSAVHQPANEAYETVKNAERFTVGGVGFAGIPSGQETAFRRLLKEPEALARCQKLLTEATPAGQLYGLLGLRLLDQRAFQAALPRYKDAKTEVPTMRGCIVMITTAAKLSAQIEKGELK